MNNQVLADLHHPDAVRRRQAVVDAARQRLTAALPDLMAIADSDADSEIRSVAKKAVQYLQQDDPLGLDEAERLFIVALKTYKQRGAEASAKYLAKALALDPTLQEDEVAQRIAAQITKLPPEEAAKALAEAGQYGQTYRPDRGGWVLRNKRRRSSSGVAVIILFSIVMIMLFVATGAFDYYSKSIQSYQWRERLHATSSNVEYYMFVPDGDPPALGWGTLLVLHDYGYRAENLLSYFIELADSARLVLIAPNFGEYPVPLSEETTPEINEIMSQVRTELNTDPLGVVVFGVGVGGEVATLFASEYYPIAGVIASGATDLYLPPSDDPLLPYLIMYGEYDPMRTAIGDRVTEFEALTNPVVFHTLWNEDTGITQTQAELTVQAALEIYEKR